MAGTTAATTVSTNVPQMRLDHIRPVPLVSEPRDPHYMPEGRAPGAAGALGGPEAYGDHLSTSGAAYCKMAMPAPRPQNVDASRNETLYPKYQQNPYQRGQLYATPNGVLDGGPDNANWVRGNQFADNYSYATIWGSGQPEGGDANASLAAGSQNVAGEVFGDQRVAPVIQSQYYPFPTYFDRIDRRYKGYPVWGDGYASAGGKSTGPYPFYIEPHQTINGSRNDVSGAILDMPVNTLEGFVGDAAHQPGTLERFDNQIGTPLTLCCTVGVLLLLVYAGTKMRRR